MLDFTGSYIALSFAVHSNSHANITCDSAENFIKLEDIRDRIEKVVKVIREHME